jgi:hypothetical protein
VFLPKSAEQNVGKALAGIPAKQRVRKCKKTKGANFGGCKRVRKAMKRKKMTFSVG